MLFMQHCQRREMTTCDRQCKQAYPVCGAEVNSFSKVISLIEATVVGSGEGDDELTSTLVGAHNLPIRNTINQRKLFNKPRFCCGNVCVYVRLTGTP